MRVRVGVVALAVALVVGGVGAGAYAAFGDDGGPAFRDVAAQRGLTYSGVSLPTNGKSANEGVYVLDYDSDGWSDLLLVGGRRPVLFENTGGEFERSGALPADALDRKVNFALPFDRGQDGDPDLLLLTDHGRPVFLANTGGEFEVRDVGFDEPLARPVAASVADYDGDGHLDVFVAQYGDWDEAAPAGFRHPRRDVTNDTGTPNVLYRGTDDGFERVTDAGVSGARWSLATSFVDLTGDGRPDVHVANDFNNDTLYVNQGDGTFRQVTMGAATDRNGMSSEVFDANGDGRPDLFVTNIYLPREATGPARTGIEAKDRLMSRMELVFEKRLHGNNLLINRGNGTFVDRAGAYNVSEGGWGWAATAVDFDDDGDRDLFQTTQRISSDTFGLSNEDSPLLRTPMLWERRGEAFVGLNATRAGFDATDGRGVAAVDFDRDGDRDLVVAVHGGRFRLYENRVDGGHWLDLSVRPAGETPALGAEVFVTVDGETRRLVQHARADYLSRESPVTHVGLGAAETVDRVRVVWPDGTELVVTDVAADRKLVLAPDGATESER